MKEPINYDEVPQYQNNQQNYPVHLNNENTIRYHTDPTEIIEEIEHILKNEYLTINPDTGEEEYIKPKGAKPLISNDGLQTLLIILRSKLTKIFSLSDFERFEIENILISTGDNIIFYIEDNWDTLEIPSISHASIISNTIIDTVFATLKKSYQGKLLNHMRTIQTVNESNVINQQGASMMPKENPSMWKRMMPKFLR